MKIKNKCTKYVWHKSNLSLKKKINKYNYYNILYPFTLYDGRCESYILVGMDSVVNFLSLYL